MGEMTLKGLRVLGTLMNRASLAAGLGKGFSGKRDYYNVFGYNHSPTFRDKMFMYARQGVAGRVVDAPAQALWNNPPVIKSNNPLWDQAWNNILVRHSLWNNILKADKLAGVGLYSCIHVGLQGYSRSDLPVFDVKKDVTTLEELNNINYMQVLSQEAIKVQTLYHDTSNPKFNEPETYLMTLNNSILSNSNGIDTNLPTGASSTSMPVHESRIIHVAENTFENLYFGNPRLLRVYNDLTDLLKVSGGSAEAFWLTSNRGMQIDVDKEVAMTPEHEEALTEEVEEYVHQLSRIIRTRGTKINELGGNVTDPKGTFDMLMSVISGASGIPKRILLGAEAGQLASEQDRANWSDRVKERRKEFGEPAVILPTLRKLTSIGVLPFFDNLEITIMWPDAYILSPLERAAEAAQHARSVLNFARTFTEMNKAYDNFIKRQEAVADLDQKEVELDNLKNPEVDENGNQLAMDLGDDNGESNGPVDASMAATNAANDSEEASGGGTRSAGISAMIKALEKGTITLDEAKESFVEFHDMITVEEVRDLIGLKLPEAAINTPEDLVDANSKRTSKRGATVQYLFGDIF